jgi:ankyrin repeat protein
MRDCAAKVFVKDQARLYNKSATDKSAERAAKKQKKNELSVKKLAAAAQNRPPSLDFSSVEPPAIVPEPVIFNPERHRTTLLAILNDPSNGIYKVKEMFSNPPVDLDLNITIDGDGNTVLYWAAALGRVHLIESILNSSVAGSSAANTAIQNFHGETVLMGAVQAMPSYDSHTFSRIVECLTRCIAIVDSRKRSVLHHIVIAASKTTGKSVIECENIAAAARYYMECVLERIALTTQDFTLIDVQDQNGDTALNIAARIGCKNLIDQLIAVGASPHLENRAGLRPVDFGLEIKVKTSMPVEEFDDCEMMHFESEHDPIVRDVYDGVDDWADDDDSNEVVVQDSMDYEDTMAHHQFISHDFGMGGCPEEASRIAKTKQAGREAKTTRPGQSSSYSARDIYPSLVDAAQMAFEEENHPSAHPSSSGFEGRIEQTRAAINNRLKGKGQEIARGLCVHLSNVKVIQGMVDEMKNEYNVELGTKRDLLTDAQSDLRQVASKLAQMRRANSVIKAENAKIPSLILRIQNLEACLSQEIGKKYSPISTCEETSESLAVHKQIESTLRQEILSLQSRANESEHKFRKIIGRCAGIPDDSVDEMMDSLVAAVESDEACRVNVSQLSDFMAGAKAQEQEDLSL